MSSQPAQPDAKRYTLTEQPGRYAVCLLPSASSVPGWAQQGAFWNVTQTPDELSIICAQEHVPHALTDAVAHAAASDLQASRDWVLLRVEGPFDFSVTGVLAALTRVLAAAAVPCLAIATYQTDYLLFQAQHQAAACAALTAAGHRYRTG